MQDISANSPDVWRTSLSQIPELKHDFYIRRYFLWKKTVNISPQLIQDVYENRYFPWKTPSVWIYRPLNMRRFSRRYDWLKPGDITQHARKMKFQMKFVIKF